MNPAIVAVGYNRPDDLERLLTSVNNAAYDSDDIPLVISLDKAANEADVLAVAEAFEWKHGEKIIRTFPERQGLRRHVLQCGDLSEKYGSVIILEDDLLVSPMFYKYVLQALDFYKDRQEIAGVSLYSHEWNGYARKHFRPIVDQYDAFLGQIGVSWGQCWTANAWSRFRAWYAEHEDKLEENFDVPYSINKWSSHSWGKYFTFYIVEKDLYYVMPRTSLSTNYSDVGQHAAMADNVYQVRLLQATDMQYRFPQPEEALRYDIFFENMTLAEHFPEELRRDGLCIDLIGLERVQLRQRYLLSTRRLPYAVIKSYGLQLRPAEMNVWQDIPGDDIFLYDTHTPAKAPADNRFRVFRYEIRGFSVKEIWYYATRLLKLSLSTHLAARLRKR